MYISTHTNKFNIFVNFFLFTLYGYSWRDSIYSIFNYDTVSDLIILSINVFYISVCNVCDGIIYITIGTFLSHAEYTSNSYSLFKRVWPVNRVNNFAYRFRIWCHYQISDYAYCLCYSLTCKRLTRSTQMNCSCIKNIGYKDFYNIYESIRYAFIKPFTLYRHGYMLLNFIIFFTLFYSSLLHSSKLYYYCFLQWK